MFLFSTKIKIETEINFIRDQTRPSIPENNVRMTESGSMYVFFFPFESILGKMDMIKF